MKRHKLSSALLLSLACGVACCAATGRSTQDVREPIGAGQFYPRSAATLRSALRAMMADALPPRPDRPVAIVVPHAGYIYSGQIAADAYRQASAHRYDTVVIVGTNHTDGGFRKVAILPGRSFKTPLGNAPIDDAFVAALMKADSDCVFDAAPHRAEHSVEVQVPFVQHLFPNARLVPIVVGRPDQAMCERLGRALASVAKDRSVLIVASSDLSHYPSADNASAVDRGTLETIASMDVQALYDREFGRQSAQVPELVTHACGSGPVMTAIAAARALGAARAVALSYANSADVAVGDPERVVGYGAVVFSAGGPSSDVSALKTPPPDAGALQADDKKALLAYARNTLTRYLGTETLPLARGFSARVNRKGGVFVTLKKQGELRGCIGHIPSDSAVAGLVGRMALESALNDPRFPKVTADELRGLELEISVLTPPKRVGGATDIVVGRDGVFLDADGRGAVFLPQVAPEQGWNRDEMLDNLCVKAGLPANRWRRPGVTYSTFQADVFGEGHR
ncbi:MAG: AmmeMemoRadiSam system protein B [Bacteroidales bacterium]